MHSKFLLLIPAWQSLLAILCVFSILSSCASVATRLPPAASSAVAVEKDGQTQTALDIYEGMNARLQAIARPILRENAPLCKRTRGDIGVQTATLKSYPKALSALAEKTLNIGKEPQVVFVYAGVSGIKVGDEIVQNGKPVSANKIRIDGGDIYIRSPKSGTDLLTQAAFDTSKAVTICDYPVTLRYSAAINAYATGRSIIVTTRMMDFATDDELALVVGHELAHNTHSHVRKVIQNRIISFGAGRFTRQFESEADYVGLYYMARAGYDPQKAIGFWRRLAQISVNALYEAKSHPITAERYVRLQQAALEIESKRLQSKDGSQTFLIPNTKK